MKILGTGSYVPDRVVGNADLETLMQTTADFIFRRTGIIERRWATPGTGASTLAISACKAALDDAKILPEYIDAIVCNTLSGDVDTPGTGLLLAEPLGLRAGIPIWDVRQQCAGLLYGLDLADMLIKSGRCRHVLIVCTEVLSSRIDTSLEGRNLAVLLGDGAGAVVVGPSEPASGLLWIRTHADGSGAGTLLSPGLGSQNPNFFDIQKGGVKLRMPGGKHLAKEGVRLMVESARSALTATGLCLEQVRVIPHQPNLRMVEAVLNELGTNSERVFINVQRYGNMGSATLPVALDQARRQQWVKPGDHLLLVGFGAGNTWGAAVFKL